MASPESLNPAERALRRFRWIAALAIVAGAVLVNRGAVQVGWFVVAVGAVASIAGWLAAERMQRDRHPGGS